LGVNVTSILNATVLVALPILSLVVFVAGLLWRGACPSWLLVCAAVSPALAIVSLLVLQQRNAGDFISLTHVLVAWFVLCLIVLGLAVMRRLTAQPSRWLQYAGLTMPFIAFGALVGIVLMFLVLARLTPTPAS
jgi:hypothetical protein